MKVLLYSGGLDSYIISRLEKPDKNIYFDLGLEYNRAEMENLKRLNLPVMVLRPFGVGGVGGLGPYELQNKIIPLRNLYMVMLASNYGNEIILGATAGDTTHDKDQIFCDKVTDLIRYVFDPPDKAPRVCRPPDKFVVRVPYKRKTKSELVKAYLSMGFDRKWLYRTRSCYESERKECGRCRSCFRKAVALRNNGVFDVSVFDKDPFEESFARGQLEYAEGRGREKETEEIKRALGIRKKRRRRRRL